MSETTVDPGGQVPDDAPKTPLLEEALEHRRPHAEGGEHGPHPTDATYIRIAIILAVVTAVEVGLYYIKPKGSGVDVTNSFLLVLAALKFAIVALYFMHLRFDNRILRRLFIVGLVTALTVYIAYLQTLHVFW